MNSSRLILRPVRPEDETSFKRAVDAFKKETPPWTFAFHFDESECFKRYVKTLDGWSLGIGVPERFVPNTFLVGVVNNVVVGRLSLRHCLNEFLERTGGHIGYGVIPGFRQKGYATEMVRQALPLCASLGIEQVLITCDTGNVGSRRVIEHCGGVFESVTNEPDIEIQKRRYWIRTSS